MVCVLHPALKKLIFCTSTRKATPRFASRGEKSGQMSANASVSSPHMSIGTATGRKMLAWRIAESTLRAHLEHLLSVYGRQSFALVYRLPERAMPLKIISHCSYTCTHQFCGIYLFNDAALCTCRYNLTRALIASHGRRSGLLPASRRARAFVRLSKNGN